MSTRDPLQKGDFGPFAQNLAAADYFQHNQQLGVSLAGSPRGKQPSKEVDEMHWLPGQDEGGASAGTVSDGQI